MKYLATFTLGVTLIFHTVACAPPEDEQETQSNQVASGADDPKTVFQDTTEIFVERIIEDDSIVVGVIIDEENLMSPHDRQPGVAFVGEIEKLNANGGLLGKQVTIIRVNSESRLSVIDNAAKKLIEAGAQLLVLTCELDYAGPALIRAKEAEHQLYQIVLYPLNFQKLNLLLI